MNIAFQILAATAAVVGDGTNPIIKSRFTPDPAGVVDGEWLYVFTGHDEPGARRYTMKDWQVFGTTNLTDWVDFGPVMDTSVFTWARQGDRAWASQAIARDGKWYWYCAVAEEGAHDAIGVAVADRVEGPWTDPIGRPLLRGRAGYIDPSVLVDDDGRAYLFWGNCGGDPGAWYCELKRNMVEIEGEVKPVPGLMDEKAFGKPLKKQRGAGAGKPLNTNFEEAPWIYKVGDTYHLEYAAGGVPEHWAYSTAKSIHGPWTYRGRIMDEPLGTGTIHGGSVFFKGDWYMIYHNAALPDGADHRRSFCIERYERNADGSIPFIHPTKAGVSFSPMRRPTLWADVPDMAVVQRGGRYYMVSTTMHFNPGIPVMVSEDLVHWRIASYCYPTIEDRPQDRLEGGGNDYSFGTWASSIRFNEQDGHFYVMSFNNRVDATYLFRTKDPEAGAWEFFRLHPRQYDESLWIEDGRFWVYATVPGRPYKVRLTEMKPDFSGFVDGGEIVLPAVTDVVGGDGLGEGAQVLKRNGWYYIVNICWPGGRCRNVVVHRSRTMRGPWEGKVVFEHEGIAQGSFVEGPDGKWRAYFFGDRGGVGRCPYFMDAEWVDDWPIPSREAYARARGLPGIVASDDFSSPELAKVWQWNHNPVTDLWSLRERPGWLRLKTGRVDGDILSARNTLTQRTWGPACRAETTLDFTGLQDGDVAGLTLFQKEWGFVGVTKEGGGAFILCRGAKMQEVKVKLPSSAGSVQLRATCDFSPMPNPSYRTIPAAADKGRFFWSLNGENWQPIGGEMNLPYTIPHFIGYRFGLFCYSTAVFGGHADFDGLRLK